MYIYSLSLNFANHSFQGWNHDFSLEIQSTEGPSLIFKPKSRYNLTKYINILRKISKPEGGVGGHGPRPSLAASSHAMTLS
jgi:hypothetical protein